MAYLVLVRHGQSKWNALGQWSGLIDVELTEKGRAEARAAARTLEGITFGAAHTSKLQQHGEEKFIKWRRSWDYPVPGGETLKDVHDHTLLKSCNTCRPRSYQYSPQPLTRILTWQKIP